MNCIPSQPFLTRALASLWIMLAAFTLTKAAADQPNVIVLFADDLGYGELSCHQNTSGPPLRFGPEVF